MTSACWRYDCKFGRGARVVLAGALTFALVACTGDGGQAPSGRDAGTTPSDAGTDLSDDAAADGSAMAGDGGGLDAAAQEVGGDPGGSPDGLPADAPPLCTPRGACSPFGVNTCPTGQTCRAETGGTLCGLVPAMPFLEGQTCQATFECGPGLACINLDAQGPRCHRLCPANQVGFCGPGLACSTQVAGDSCLKLCTPLAPACDIYDPQSCPAPNAKCDLAVHPETAARYTGCLSAGAGQVGDPCGGGSACGRGLICINVGTGAACRQVCDVSDGTPGCTVAGQSCTGRSSLYGVTFCL